MSDKALQEAKWAKQQAQFDAERAERAKEQARQEEKERRKAQDDAKTVERASERFKMTYKALFIGNMVFTLVLAFFVAYGKRGVLPEMAKWFPDRLGNIKNLFFGMFELYRGLVKLIGSTFHLSAAWCYVIVTLIIIGLIAGLYFQYPKALSKMHGVIYQIRRQYTDGVFKAVVSADIILLMLYVCLFFTAALKKLLPFNILSIWILLSCIGCFAWNFHEIMKGLERS